MSASVTPFIKHWCKVPVETFASGQKTKALEYEKGKIDAWEKAINLAKEKNEICPDTNATLLASTFHNLYMGLSYGGALVDKLSIPDLERLWDYIYQQHIIK